MANERLFAVIVANRARRSLKKLTNNYRRRVLELLRLLQNDPVPAALYDLKKLKGLEDTFRVRIGDIRVVYEVSWEKRAVHVLVIESREGAYG